MKTTYGLSEVMVKERIGAKSNVFMSTQFGKPDVKANAGKAALVLIQGTGAVRAGTWANSVAINESLSLGTMLPQVDWAVNIAQIPVIVMNPNFASSLLAPKQIKKDDPYQYMKEHCDYVWTKFVAPSGFSKLLVIAHSAGGYCLTSII
jgi:hypothetical protein